MCPWSPESRELDVGAETEVMEAFLLKLSFMNALSCNKEMEEGSGKTKRLLKWSRNLLLSAVH